MNLKQVGGILASQFRNKQKKGIKTANNLRKKLNYTYNFSVARKDGKK